MNAEDVAGLVVREVGNVALERELERVLTPAGR